MQPSTERQLLELMASAFYGRSRVYVAVLEELEEHLDRWYAAYVLDDAIAKLGVAPAGFEVRHATAFVLEYLPGYLAHVPTAQSQWVCQALFRRVASMALATRPPPRAP